MHKFSLGIIDESKLFENQVTLIIGSFYQKRDLSLRFLSYPKIALYVKL